MLTENKEAFDEFAKVHFEYSADQTTMQNKFNEVGYKITEIVHDYENRLCSNTERGMYNKYSSGLSEKFQALVKSHFPLIDHVGLIAEEQPPSAPDFTLKKIVL